MDLTLSPAPAGPPRARPRESFLESALDDETHDEGDALDDEPAFARQVRGVMAARQEEVGSAAGPSAAADGVVVAVPGRAPRWSAQL